MKGYTGAAANFSKEANLKPQQQDWSIRTRQKIQNSIHMGKIEDAIVALNCLSPQVCSLLVFVPCIPPQQHRLGLELFHAPLIGLCALDETTTTLKIMSRKILLFYLQSSVWFPEANFLLRSWMKTSHCILPCFACSWWNSSATARMGIPRLPWLLQRSSWAPEPRQGPSSFGTWSRPCRCCSSRQTSCLLS